MPGPGPRVSRGRRDEVATLSAAPPSSERLRHRTRASALAADRVALHAARVRGGLQLTVRLAADGAHPAERPRRRRLALVAAGPQAGQGRLARAILDRDVPGPRRPRVERAREGLG